MRILVISNFYPPHAIGGYERGCHEVVRLLESRGHDVVVLTSWFGLEGPAGEGGVKRWLQPLPMPGSRHALSPRLLAAREFSTQRAFDRVWREFRPDVISLWNLARLPMSLAHRAEAWGPVCYYVSDAWLAKWTEPGWYGDPWLCLNRQATGAPARMIARAARGAFSAAGLTWTTASLRLTDVQFCSAFMKEATLAAGRPVLDAEVVPWGVDVGRFAPAAADESERPGIRLLFVGQVLPEKGVHTAIEALGRVHQAGHRRVTLTIAGTCHQPEYRQRLSGLVAAWNLDSAVAFIGAQPHETIPSVYTAHDVLVFPSCWDEPFAITPLEAMASGLVVVGSTAGGSGELFAHEQNALTFRPEDTIGCAAQLMRVLANRDFARALARRAIRTVRERYTLDGMVDRIEGHLRQAAARVAVTKVVHGS